MKGKMNEPGKYAAEMEEARAALDRHMSALNRRDRQGLADSLHFPHFRLSGGRMKVWERPDSYLDDFYARAGGKWHHSEWDFVTAIAAGADKVHFDVQFTRYGNDGASLGSYRSLWVVTKLNGIWATQLRSSYAA